jgi:hypothetical protein
MSAVNIPFQLPAKDEIPSLSQLKADATTVAGLLAKAEAAVAEFNAARDKIANEFASAYKTGSRAARDEVLGGKVAELKVETRQTLDDLLKQAGAPKARRDTANDYLGNPIVTVNVATLGNPKRATYVANLQNAGHASIKAAAVFAVANQDQDLVAAILDVIADRMPGERPVSPNDLTDKAPHPDYVAAKAAFRAFDRDFQKLILARRTFISPTAGVLGRVKLALDAQEEGE